MNMLKISNKIKLLQVSTINGYEMQTQKGYSFSIKILKISVTVLTMDRLLLKLSCIITFSRLNCFTLFVNFG